MPDPVLVQHATYIVGAAGLEGTVFHLSLPNATFAGNCLAICIAYNDAYAAPTIADNQGNSYGSPINPDDDATNGMKAAWYVVPNCTAGTTDLTFTFTHVAAQSEFIQFYLSEWANVATASPLDGTGAHAHSSSASWGPGTVTTGAASSVILVAAFNSQGNKPQTFTSAPTGFTFLARQEPTDSHQSTNFAVAYKVQTIAGSVTPTFASSVSCGFVSTAIALKSASAGTVPTNTPRIIGVTWLDMHSSVGVSSLAFGTPTFGDILALGLVGGASAPAAARSFSSITDTSSNSYTLTTGVGTGSCGIAQFGYKVGATTDPNMRITVTTTGDENVNPIVLWDIIGAAAGCTFDATTSNTGNQVVTANLDTVTVTPARANGVYLMVSGVNSSTLRACVSTGARTTNPWYPEEDGNTEAWHEDNGAAHWYNPSTASLTFTFSESNGVADWAAQVIGFVPPAGTSPTPAPGRSLNEARAHLKTRSRFAQLRERGGAWFRAFLPGVPLRNTTLVPAKWLELSSRIGATIIQRASTGITSIVIAGRTASTKRVQRALLTRGRFFNKNGVAMRVPTGTPATWLLSNSLIGSAAIQRPTTGVTSALFTQRDHTEHQLQRRLRASGNVTAHAFVPAPVVTTVKIHRYVFLRRTRDEFIKTRRLRPTTVIAKTGLPVIRALGWIPKPPTVLLLRKTHDERARVAHERPSTVLARTPLAAPPPPPAKKTASFLFLRRVRDTQLHVQRRATAIAYDTSLLILPSTSPVALPGARGWQGGARVVGAHRVHLRHDRASVTTRQLGAPTSPAPGNIRRIAFFILGRERAERRLRATIADRGRLYAHTWLPGPQPVTPALPRGIVLTARTDRAHQARLRHEKARFTGISWIPLRLPPIVTPPPRLRLGQIIDGRVASDRRIRLLRDQAHVRSWRYIPPSLAAPTIVTARLECFPVFTATLDTTAVITAAIDIEPEAPL